MTSTFANLRSSLMESACLLPGCGYCGVTPPLCTAVMLRGLCFELHEVTFSPSNCFVVFCVFLDKPNRCSRNTVETSGRWRIACEMLKTGQPMLLYKSPNNWARLGRCFTTLFREDNLETKANPRLMGTFYSSHLFELMILIVHCFFFFSNETFTQFVLLL